MKKVLVIGFGISGKAATAFLKKKGWEVVIFDDKLKEFNQIPSHMEEFAFCVPSPGIAKTHPIYQSALRAKVPLIGEAELGLKELDQFIIAVTGTNGKTTVVKLIEHILKCSNIKARAIGNVGTAFTQYVFEKDPEEVIIAELSSYQLETLSSQVFDIGLILNVTPDHLDRYSSLEEYGKTKCLLQKFMKKNSPFYVNHQVVLSYKKYLHDPYIIFGSDAAKCDIWIENNTIIDKEKNLFRLTSVYENFAVHDKENALAAWIAVSRLVSQDQFTSALKSFKKPSHRIEFVAKINEVSYFDDSKGTNIDAVNKAVDAMQGPVILIAGGVDKQLSFERWKSFKEKVKKMILIGQTKDIIYEELKEDFNIEKVDSLLQAVEKANQAATSGDNVLLSPGCSSFDMFEDYAHRGNEFKRFVYEIEERRKKQ